MSQPNNKPNVGDMSKQDEWLFIFLAAVMSTALYVLSVVAFGYIKGTLVILAWSAFEVLIGKWVFLELNK